MEEILEKGDRAEVRALFAFDENTTDEDVLLKFKIWSRWFLPDYFLDDTGEVVKDAPFHRDFDLQNLNVYRGFESHFVNVGFRGSAKDSRTKPFIAFAIANDEDHYRKYIKVLTSDFDNSRQIVTDIYNIFVSPRIIHYYPEIFSKIDDKKREERMSSFTTATGVKVTAGTVGMEQRGDIQEDARPDLLWCHKKGTMIRDKGGWQRVEEHPSFQKYRREGGVKVFLNGLPEEEIVTKEHRYWVRTMKVGKRTGEETRFVYEGWKEAKDLTKHDYIGSKIREDVVEPPMLKRYFPGVITERNRKGQVVKATGEYRKVVLPEFKDPEWWWFLGLWWGDGHISPYSVNVTIGDKDKEIYERVRNLLVAYKIKHSIVPERGCFRVVFSHAVLSRWLKTWYIGGNSQKVPPDWIEFIDKKLQKPFILGLIDADGHEDKKGKCVRVVSVCLPGLIMARRILARLSVPASIRVTAEAKRAFVVDRWCNVQKRYDLRFRENAKALGFDIENQSRYMFPQAFIGNGFLWTKVSDVEESGEEEFCPISTETETYETYFGLSHNCNDFESRKTLRSAVVTQSIWDNMEEARTGLSKSGGAIYTCNYISERGNVHKLIQNRDNTLITPIERDGKPTWDRYTKEDIERLRRDADDFAGEYMCEPSAGGDIFFDRVMVDRQVTKTPIREIAGFKIFHKYDPAHRYGSGHDVGGGVGLDHSTSVFIDFSTVPFRVVATYKSNTIKPDSFGDEIRSQADRFGEPIVAVENNKFDMTIGRLKQIYDNLYTKEGSAKRIKIMTPSEYGWNTNSATKPTMLYDFKKAVEDGHIELSDPDLIAEVRHYSRDDLMDRAIDPRLTTRHFDLLMAACIAYQMKDHAEVMDKERRRYEIDAKRRDNVQAATEDYGL